MVDEVVQLPRDHGHERVPGVEEREAIASANAAGIGLGGLVRDAFYERAACGGLVVGYAAAPEHTFAEATAAFAQVIATLPPRKRTFGVAYDLPRAGALTT